MKKYNQLLIVLSAVNNMPITFVAPNKLALNDATFV
jgi:hypothetical protein